MMHSRGMREVFANAVWRAACVEEESGAGAARHFDVAGHRILGRVAADVRGALAIKLVRLRNLSLGRVAALALQS